MEGILKQGMQRCFTRKDRKEIKMARKKSLRRLEEDLIDAKIAEKKLKEMKKGEVITQTEDEFLKDLEKWAKEE